MMESRGADLANRPHSLVLPYLKLIIVKIHGADI